MYRGSPGKFLILGLAGTALVGLNTIIGQVARDPWSLGLATAESLFVVLPVLLGIGIGLFEIRDVRSAVWAGVVCSGLMLAQDFLPRAPRPPADRQMNLIAADGSPVENPRPELIRWSESGAFARFVAPPDPDRLAYEQPLAAMKVGYILFVPLIVLTGMLSVLRWSSQILFVSDAVETIFRFVIAFVLPALLVWLPVTFADKVLGRVVFDGLPHAAVFLPFMTLAALFSVGAALSFRHDGTLRN